MTKLIRNTISILEYSKILTDLQKTLKLHSEIANNTLRYIHPEYFHHFSTSNVANKLPLHAIISSY